MDASTPPPLCLVNEQGAAWEDLLKVATQNYGHITMLQMRRGMVRGLEHHLRRLDGANRELFGRPLAAGRVIDSLKVVAAERPDATVRVNVFEGAAYENIMVTATAPVEPEWRPARFSLVPFERDLPHLKHVGGFGLLLRQRRAAEEGYDGAVFFDRHGQVSEATLWNVGFFRDEAVIWPSAGSLRGVTQIIIDEGLAAMGLASRYEPVWVDALGRYEAAFLSNSATYGRPLGAIGDVRFETSPSATEVIRAAYERTPMLPLAGF